MTRHNSHPNSDYQESPVALRYSFADMTRQDVNFKRQGTSGRIISYPTPSDEERLLRRSLAAHGLVTGDQIEDGDDRVERFAILGRLRPISHDTSTHSSSGSDFGYDDAQLFFDLGRLLGLVAQEGPELPLVLDDTIGQNIAIDEFTRLGEPRIFLVPGFERRVATAENDDAALDFYADRLHDEFGPRFSQGQERFVEGFRTTLE